MRELHKRLYNQRRKAIREKRPREYVDGLGAAIVALTRQIDEQIARNEARRISGASHG
jgi:hypothetical protein